MSSRVLEGNIGSESVFTPIRLVLISREVLGREEVDLNLRRKWKSIISTCNTIFKLMVYKQHIHRRQTKVEAYRLGSNQNLF
jgi:uncharacterized membrane protein